MTQNHGTKETYHRLPNKQVVLASGTVNDEHGVFFKWRDSSQVSLEGAREVTIRFLVPRQWRGDWVQARCEMLATVRNYLGKKVESCEEARVVVAMYLSGDAVAQSAARELSEAQCSVVCHTVNKPNTSRKGSPVTEWLTLSPLFKTAGHTGSPTIRTASSRQDDKSGEVDLTSALDRLRQLSGK